jgi:hypothetical protein
VVSGLYEAIVATEKITSHHPGPGREIQRVHAEQQAALGPRQDNGRQAPGEKAEETPEFV